MQVNPKPRLFATLNPKPSLNPKPVNPKHRLFKPTLALHPVFGGAPQLLHRLHAVLILSRPRGNYFKRSLPKRPWPFSFCYVGTASHDTLLPESYILHAEP